MTEQTAQITDQPNTVPTEVTLEDVIEAMVRGVARAEAAAEDVSGYAVPSLPYYFGVTLNGWFIPLGPPQRPGGQQIPL